MKKIFSALLLIGLIFTYAHAKDDSQSNMTKKILKAKDRRSKKEIEEGEKRHDAVVKELEKCSNLSFMERLDCVNGKYGK